MEGPQDRFSLTLLVNDNDGDGRKGWLEWGAGIGRTSNTDAFNEMTVLETGPMTNPPEETPTTADGSTSTLTPTDHDEGDGRTTRPAETVAPAETAAGSTSTSAPGVGVLGALAALLAGARYASRRR